MKYKNELQISCDNHIFWCRVLNGAQRAPMFAQKWECICAVQGRYQRYKVSFFMVRLQTSVNCILSPQ